MQIGQLTATSYSITEAERLKSVLQNVNETHSPSWYLNKQTQRAKNNLSVLAPHYLFAVWIVWKTPAWSE